MWRARSESGAEALNDSEASVPEGSQSKPKVYTLRHPAFFLKDYVRWGVNPRVLGF